MAYQAIGPRRSSAGIPLTTMLPESADSEHLPGALLLVDANGNADECGADPAAIFGVAVTGGFDAAVGTKQTEFHQIDAQGEWDGVAKGVLTATMVGEGFGVLKHSDNVWVVDLSDTTATRVTITEIPSTSVIGGTDQIVCFRFKQANIQTP